MDTVLDLNRWLHVAAGFIGLAAFWIPVFTRKGGTNHRFFGKIFKYCAYVVLLAALLSVALNLSDALSRGIGPSNEPGNFAFLVFLGYLALVTFIILRHGMQVLEYKSRLTDLDTLLNRSLAWLSVASSIFLVAYALYFNPPVKVLLFALSPIGILSGLGILKVLQGKRTESKAWMYEHMGAMIGVGIAFHTAFAVFGSRQLFDLGLTGFVAVIPWILPAAIGVPATFIWTRHYQRKFGDVPA